MQIPVAHAKEFSPLGLEYLQSKKSSIETFHGSFYLKKHEGTGMEEEIYFCPHSVVWSVGSSVKKVYSIGSSEKILYALRTNFVKEGLIKWATCVITASCLHAFYDDGRREVCPLPAVPIGAWCLEGLSLVIQYSDYHMIYLPTPYSPLIPVSLSGAKNQNDLFQDIRILKTLQVPTFGTLLLGFCEAENRLTVFYRCTDDLTTHEENQMIRFRICFQIDSPSANCDFCFYHSLDNQIVLVVLSNDLLHGYTIMDGMTFHEVFSYPAVGIAALETFRPNKLDLIVMINDWVLSIQFHMTPELYIDLSSALIVPKADADHRVTRGLSKKIRMLKISNALQTRVNIHFHHGLCVRASLKYHSGSSLVNDIFDVFSKHLDTPSFNLILKLYVTARFAIFKKDDFEILSSICFKLVPLNDKKREQLSSTLGLVENDILKSLILCSVEELNATGPATIDPSMFTQTLFAYSKFPLKKKDLFALSSLVFILSYSTGNREMISFIEKQFSIFEVISKRLNWETSFTTFQSLKGNDGFIGHLKNAIETSSSRNIIEKLTFFLDNKSIFDIYQLPAPYRLVILEVFHYLRYHQNDDLTPAVLNLIGREDLAAIHGQVKINLKSSPAREHSKGSPISDFGFEQSDANKTEFENHCSLLFPDDNRLDQVVNMFSLDKKYSIEISNSAEEDPALATQEILQHYGVRKFGSLVGRSMLYLFSKSSSMQDSICIPELSVLGKISGSKIQVKLDLNSLSSSYTDWPSFHAGVFSSLQINPDNLEIDGTWIVYNRPEELNFSHAGFLLGLGLTGMLRKLKPYHEFEYFNSKHELTTSSLLLGLAASHIGSESERITKIVSVHLPALFPPNSSAVNRSLSIQLCSLMSLGFLYLATANKKYSSMALSEINCSSYISESQNTFSEEYSLSAGFCFGLINLGCGLFSDGATNIESLKRNIQGGSLNSFTGKNTSQVHTDVTAPAAIIALTLSYLKSCDAQIASILDLPSNLVELKSLSPERILLSVIGKALIMWDNIQTTINWIYILIPRCMYFTVASEILDDDIGMQIFVGACFAMSIKFAGSADIDVFEIFENCYSRLSKIVSKTSQNSVNSKYLWSKAKACVDLLNASIGILMAGTGNVKALRILRKQRLRVNKNFTYGNHMAIHMAIGLLFLGQGRFTLSTSNIAIASLLLAFYPRFPTTTMDNRPHFQAFRAFWFLAVESRHVVIRDIDSKKDVFAEVEIHLKNGEFVRKKTPIFLPPVEEIQNLRFVTEDFYPLSLTPSIALHYEYLTNSKIIYVKKIQNQEYFSSINEVVSWFKVDSDLPAGLSIFDKFYAKYFEIAEDGLLSKRDVKQLRMLLSSSSPSLVAVQSTLDELVPMLKQFNLSTKDKKDMIFILLLQNENLEISAIDQCLQIN